jgi:hypothetical protein
MSMRPILALGAALIALAAFLPVRHDTQSVTVHAVCANGQLGDHSVTPEDVTVAQDEDVSWELDDASTATDLTVQPKHNGHWPWANDEHFKGGKGHGHGANANGKHMNKNAAGTYPYNIALTCPDGHGGTTTVTIDPSIIIH